MGSTCMKGPSFWCSASSSAKYWLHKTINYRAITSPSPFIHQSKTNRKKKKQRRQKTNLATTNWPRNKQRNHEKSMRRLYLSTSGLLLIWGDRFLEGENPCWPYSPDMAAAAPAPERRRHRTPQPRPRRGGGGGVWVGWQGEERWKGSLL